MGPLPIRQPHASTSAPTAMPKPSYASVLKTHTEDTNPMPLAQHYLQDEEQTAIAIQGTKEDELDGYKNDERAFLNQVVPNVRVRLDRMIELPLPFREAKPTFPSNRTIALKRTESALKSLRKSPEFFQKHLTSLPSTWTGKSLDSNLSLRNTVSTRMAMPIISHSSRSTKRAKPE